VAKLSDFAAYQPAGRNFLAESLVEANSRKIHPQFHWSNTRIEETVGSAESRPYMRDQAIDAVSRRKNLHSVLDRCLSDAGYTQEEAKRFHARLDRLMDEEARGPASASESEEPEEDDEEEEEVDEELPSVEEALDGLKIELKRALRTKTRRKTSYATDSAFVAAHLNPNQSCLHASGQIYDMAYSKQRNNPQREFWVGLWQFLHDQKPGTRVRDVNQATLSALISKTLAA